jgi:hypothetical protein
VGTRCRVSYLDSRNIEHAVDVTADSLFEAAAVAVRAFREGALVDDLPVAGTELRIAVFPLPVEHRVRLQRVEQWAQTGTVKSPVEMLRRERVRELLGLKNERCQVSRAALNDCQGIEPPSSGISIVLSFTASPIHSKNSSLLPTTAIGRYPRPSNG